MTIEQARRKLGKKAEKYSDQQIQDIINLLTLVVNKAIDSALENNK